MSIADIDEPEARSLKRLGGYRFLLGLLGTLTNLVSFQSCILRFSAWQTFGMGNR